MIFTDMSSQYLRKGSSEGKSLKFRFLDLSPEMLCFLWINCLKLSAEWPCLYMFPSASWRLLKIDTEEVMQSYRDDIKSFDKKQDIFGCFLFTTHKDKKQYSKILFVFGSRSLPLSKSVFVGSWNVTLHWSKLISYSSSSSSLLIPGKLSALKNM